MQLQPSGKEQTRVSVEFGRLISEGKVQLLWLWREEEEELAEVDREQR